MKCCKCKKKVEAKATKAGGERLPKGWKRHLGKTWCDSCWRDAYKLRAITIPVVGPVGRDWKELRAALSLAWGDSTRLANWMMRELYVRDIRREPGVDKMPKRPKTYLYPETEAVAPSVSAQSRSAMEQAVTGKYSAKRYEVVWTGEAQLPTFRYPYPYSAPNQGWSATWLADEEGGNQRPVVSLLMAGERWALQLRGGHQFRRQLVAFDKIVSGEAVQGEIAIYRQRVNGSDHRNGVSDRDAGGQQASYRVMCKMVAWLPKEKERDLEGVLFLTSSPDAMLSAINAKDDHQFTINAEHIR